MFKISRDTIEYPYTNYVVDESNDEYLSESKITTFYLFI